MLRARVEPIPRIEYSINGTAIGDGTSAEPKHIWAVNCVLEKSEVRTLEAIYWEFDRLRRKVPYNGECVRVADTNQEFIERLPRTRAAVPGFSVIPEGANYIAYFAYFNTWFVKPPEYDELGTRLAASFTLQETSKVVIA